MLHTTRCAEFRRGDDRSNRQGVHERRPRLRRDAVWCVSQYPRFYAVPVGAISCLQSERTVQFASRRPFQPFPGCETSYSCSLVSYRRAARLVHCGVTVPPPRQELLKAGHSSNAYAVQLPF